MAGSTVTQAQKDSADLNMTPMIDCVFQLIIFFMVVTEIKKSDDADVQLPRTRFVEIEPSWPNRVVINCTAAAGVAGVGTSQGPAAGAAGDRIQIRGKHFDQAGLQRYLERLDRENRALERRPPATQAQSAADAVSKLAVKIRADARCEWKTVQAVQMACMQVGVYKVSYGCEPARRTIH